MVREVWTRAIGNNGDFQGRRCRRYRNSIVKWQDSRTIHKEARPATCICVHRGRCLDVWCSGGPCTIAVCAYVITALGDMGTTNTPQTYRFLLFEQILPRHPNNLQ